MGGKLQGVLDILKECGEDGVGRGRCDKLHIGSQRLGRGRGSAGLGSIE